MLGLVVLIVFVLLALFAPLLFPKSSSTSPRPPAGSSRGRPRPMAGHGRLRSQRPRPGHLGGTGLAARGALRATALSMIIGTTIGIMSGHYRGRVGGLLDRFTDWFLVIPFLPLAIVLATVLGPSLLNIIIVIGVTSWPGTARLIRAQTLSLEGRSYLERARALGGGHAHQMSRHILPNVMPLVLANTTLAVSISILSETTLSFLGLGDPTAVSWGSILDDAFAAGAISDRRVVVHRRTRHLRRPRRPLLQPHRARSRGDPRPARLGRRLHEPAALRRRSTSPTPPARVRCLRSVASPSSRRRGDAGDRRRVGLRQDDADQLGAAAAAQDAPRSAVGSCWTTRTSWRCPSASCAPSVGARQRSCSRARMHALNPVQRIDKQLAEPILLHETISSKAADVRVGELLEQVGLPRSRARSYPHQLSGGQKQRVMIAMALACRPEAADRRRADDGPRRHGAGADPRAAQSLVRELNLGVVFISHDLSVLSSNCDRIAVMYAGKIVEEGPAASIFDDSAAPLLAAPWPAPSRGSATSSSATRRPGCPATRRSRADIPTGCSFHPRCPVAIDRCSSEEPHLAAFAPPARRPAAHAPGVLLPAWRGQQR